MSIQETHFASIANAIRQKDGTADPIKAVDFAKRILAIPTGGGGTSGISVEILEVPEPDKTVYAGYLRLPEFSLVASGVSYEILEGYA